MSLSFSTRRFRDQILALGAFSPGIVHQAGPVRQLTDGRLQARLDARAPWMTQDENGRLFINPDLSGGRAYQFADGRLFIYTSLGTADPPVDPNAPQDLSAVPLYPSDALYPADTLYPRG